MSNSTADNLHEEKVHELAILVIGIILTSVFCILGTIGNLLSVITLVRLLQWGGKCPLYLILIGLAISDTLLLTTNFFLNILVLGYHYTRFEWTHDLWINHGNIVVVIWPLLIAFQMSSIYLTVLVSYERWLAVCKPLFAVSKCSNRRIVILTLLVFVVSLLCNVPRWWEYNVIKETHNTTSSQNVTYIHINPASASAVMHTYELQSVFTFEKSGFGHNVVYKYLYGTTLYAAVFFIFPFTAITLMNVQLIIHVRENRKAWLHIKKSQRKQTKLTYIPIAIVCLFYCFGAPAVITNFFDALEITKGPKGQLFLLITNLFVILNSASNFIVYCLLGQKFRRTLAMLMTCRRRRSPIFSQETADNSSKIMQSVCSIRGVPERAATETITSL